MNLQDIIAQAGGLESIAAQVGITPQQAQSGIGALLPAVLGGFKKSAQGEAAGAGAGAGGLMDMLQGLGGGALLDNVLGQQPTDVNAGNNVLGQIFGSKDVSRVVAAHAATQTGLDSSVLKKLLPLVAMLAAGYMAKQAGSAQATGEGGLGGLLGGLLGGGQGSGGGLGGLLGGLLGGGGQAAPAAQGTSGGLGSMLDLNGDGNPLDDILGMAGKAFGR